MKLTNESDNKDPLFTAKPWFLVTAQVAQMYEDVGNRLDAGVTEVSPWLRDAFTNLVAKARKDTDADVFDYLGECTKTQSLFDIWVLLGQVMATRLRFLTEEGKRQFFGFRKQDDAR